MQTNTRELVNQAKTGNKNAFAELYSLFYKDFYRFAFYYLGNREDAEDAVADSVSDALSSVSGIKSPEAFKTWMFTILSRTCKRRIRLMIFEKSTVPFDDLSSLGQETDMTEALLLREKIVSLAADERSIILLSIIGGYSSKEISKLVKKPDSTVRSKLSRALAKLKKEI